MHKKSFGQHFLHDAAIIGEIISAAALTGNERVVEIGPGDGAITRHLPQENLTLIEADRDLLEDLQTQFPEATIVHADAATVDYNGLTQGEDWVLISNLPYNASSAIIMQALKTSHPPLRLAVMMQREVADRMRAKPGDMSALSVATQLYCKVKLVRHVAPGAFTPPPSVQSSILLLTVKEEVDVKENEWVMQVVRAGFARKRKQLPGNIAAAGMATSDQVKQALETMGLSPTARAQELSTQQWRELAAKIS